MEIQKNNNLNPFSPKTKYRLQSIYLFIYSFIRSFIYYLLIYSFIHSFRYLLSYDKE